MATLRYYLLKKIKLERIGIIKCNLGEPIYNFCVSNNIDNLGDFLELYKKERTNISKDYDLNYFDGFVDLINLVFFKLDLPQEVLLEDSIFNDNSLRRLGFNDIETNELINHSIMFGENFKIISVFNMYLENYNFEKFNKEDEFLITKLYILSEYYDRKILLNNKDFFTAKKDIIKLKELCDKY